MAAGNKRRHRRDGDPGAQKKMNDADPRFAALQRDLASGVVGIVASGSRTDSNGQRLYAPNQLMDIGGVWAQRQELEHTPMTWGRNSKRRAKKVQSPKAAASDGRWPDLFTGTISPLEKMAG